MDTPASALPSSEITPQEWTWVQNLIQDVQRDELCDTFAKSLWQWDFVVKQFRKVEEQRVTLGSPTKDDMLYHAMCLHALIAVGQYLLFESRKLKEAELAVFGVTRDQIEAYVDDLEQSFREWHHGIPEAEVKAAQEKIFGVPA